MRNLIVYGGTFDPIHYGHLHTAVNVQQHFAFDAFHFLPSKSPLLKQQSMASAEQRLAMIELAIKTMPRKLHFHADRSEIDRPTPSYTVDTLILLRKQLGSKLPITWLLGYDVFCQLPAWHEWQHLLDLANLLVIEREGFSSKNLPSEVAALLKQHENQDKQALLVQSHGVIQRFNAGHYNISSSAVRQALLTNNRLEDSLPPVVIAYIQQHRLYT